MKNKRLLRMLSLILTLVMFLSVATPAYAWGPGDFGGGWDRDIGDDEVRDTDFGPVEEVEEYDYFQALDEENNVQVTIEAPMGSLPSLAEVRLEPIPAEDLQEAVDQLVGDNYQVLLAMDISFWLGNDEIEPEEPVRVKISSPELEGKTNLQVVHFPDDAEEPETVQLIGEEDLSFALGTNEIAFMAESFSTYAVTWSGGGTATIHWGYMEEGTFTPFSDVATLDDTAGSMSLNLIFDGYMYSTAAYVKGEVEYALDSPILTKVTEEGGSTSWTMQAHVTTGETGAPETVTIENGADIYVYYVEKSAGYTPPSPAPADVKGPVTDKNVTPNGDGTYKIHLDVTGQVDHTETRVGANVIVVMDITQSMTNNMPDGGSRMAAAKTALTTLINTLDPDTNLINFTAVNFGNSMNVTNPTQLNNGGYYWTTSKTTMQSYVNGLPNNPSDLGTCWQAGMYGAIVRANQAANDTNLSKNKTYVIFVTDGNPNAWYSNPASDGGPTTTGSWWEQSRLTQQGSGEFIQAAYDAAIPNAINASALCDHNFYGIFCGSTADMVNLENLMNYSGADGSVEGTFIDGTSAASIQSAFQGIAQTIVKDIGASNVGVDDGIPKLANVNAAVSGTADGFSYFITYPLTLVTSGDHSGQYTYTHNNEKVYVAANTVTAGAVDRNASSYQFATGYSYAEEDGVRTYYYTMVWDGAPSAGYSSSNGVTWDLEDEGVLADKTVYSLEFNVWPSQEAYDLLANLNNNMPGWTLDVLDDDTLVQLVVTLNGSDYSYTPGAAEGAGTWSDGTNTYASTEAFLAAINAAGEDAVLYNILTNTHLYTTYEYNGSSFSDPPENGLVSGAMLLEDKTIGIVKYWHNDLDAMEAEEISLTITRDGANYMDVVMGQPIRVPGTDHEWVQEPEVELYISCGIMTVDGNNNLTMNTTGHDYSVAENDGSPWYWDLTAYVYHPMVINSENTMLILVTDEEQAEPDFPSSLKTLENNKRTQVGGKWYYKFDNKLYVQTDGATNILRADNDRRSNLQITKAITGDDAPQGELFTFKVTMENKKTPYVGADGYNSDFHTFWFVVLNDPNNYCDLEPGSANFLDPENPDPSTIVWPADGLVVTGATAEVKDGSPTGYYSFDNVEGGQTVSISIKPGWRICFTSITKNTEYKIEEPGASMRDGFVVDTLSATAHCNKTGESATPGVVSTTNPALVEGSIDASNSDYRVYYTNRFVGFFYVYHSSDCTLERFPAATKGALYGGEKTFSITDLTRDGTLYGGYYSDYAGKSSGFDAAAAKALDYSGENDPADDGGTTYSLAYIKESNRGAWSKDAALTVNGFEMTPVANTVYYLKEVPTAYLQPYFHYTYSKETFEIFDAWLISDIDDALYQQTGFVIIEKNNEAKVCTALTVKTTVSGGSSVQLKPENIFRSKGVKSGYLSYLQVLADGSPTLMQEGDQVVQYWVTPDGLIVTGIAARKYSGLGNKNDLAKTDIPVEITVEVFESDELDITP